MSSRRFRGGLNFLTLINNHIARQGLQFPTLQFPTQNVRLEVGVQRAEVRDPPRKTKSINF
jgi:hypothetical protein